MRTQGPSEEISTYLLKVRDLLNQLKPPLTLGEQLDRVYQKFHPSYWLRIERKDFENFPELQRLGKREELRRAQEKAHKPLPPISDSAFPTSAYIAPKQQRYVKVAPVVQTSADEIVVTLSSSSNLAPVAATQTEDIVKDRRENGSSNQWMSSRERRRVASEMRAAKVKGAAAINKEKIKPSQRKTSRRKRS